MDRARPSAKILGRVISSRDLLQVFVDVAGIHRLSLAVLIDILEQFLSGECLTVLHDIR